MSTSNGSVPNVSAFVHDLVAMAKASEELPAIKEALASESEKNARLTQIADEREVMIEQLSAKLKATEAERDDAEIRFLELDEKAHTVLGVLDLIAAKSQAAKVQLEPVKPEPYQQPIETLADRPAEAQGESEVYPTQDGTSSSKQPDTTTDISEDGSPKPSSETVSSGQSEVDPTATENIATEASVTESSASPTSDVLPNIPFRHEEIGTGTENEASGSEGSQSEVPPTQGNENEPTTTESGGGEAAPADHGTENKPYAGVRYWELNRFISRAEWAEGGGTEEDYDWAPPSKWDAAQ